MAVDGEAAGPFVSRIREHAIASTDRDWDAEVAAFAAEVRSDPARAELAAALTEPAVAAFLAGVMSGSPYLRGLVTRDPARLERILLSVPEARFHALKADLAQSMAAAETLPDAMRLVRVFKAEVALLTGLADIAGIWPVPTVTRVLAETADAALQHGVRFLLRDAGKRGQWVIDDPTAPEKGSGYIVLGMGKHGAFELNYSSDIDLIVFYEPTVARVAEGAEVQGFFVRLTRDLVRLMAERTPDGYVFRTDLRLRPDAGATQIALSAEAALIYYESFGQNWERAALIKARPVAGDIAAGERLLGDLQPFIWRKSLDFAAIADIHAMKRQIHAFRGLGGIGVAGHNVKLGAGGIREIEFFTQTQQLIAGGRQRDLRIRATLEALAKLAERGWISPEVERDLNAAYLYLRRIEHRIQMVADEQTHELPEDGEALESFARFAGYPNLAAFSQALVDCLSRVQRHYAMLFEGAPELTAAGANMVFAGEDDDPGTVAALEQMGFAQPSQVLAAVRGWHHGRYPSVRSPRAREKLTEVQPSLIRALAETADPSRAFASFDRFLAELPAGVQVFSLLAANPKLMQLFADIMGTAPRLARVLSRRRRLLDAVLDPRTFEALPSAVEIDAVIHAEIAEARDVQDVLDRARIVGSEQSFLIGVRVLSGQLNASQAGIAYATLAERLIAALQSTVEAELEKAHGRVPGGSAAVVAMGKLGGREMTAASDLDLILVYDFDESAIQSDGERPLAPSQYYSRLTQRLITALSAATAEGTLYEVDMRLRPSGQKGPVATQLSSFVDYQVREAWTWEHMALTRARVITGPAELRAKVEDAILKTLVRLRDRGKIAADVRDMRQRIAAEKGTDNAWDLKQVRGGLVDLEFIAQHLQLVTAAAYPGCLDQNTIAAFDKLARAGTLSTTDAETLTAAARLIHDLTQILRLCIEEDFAPVAAPAGLKELLARAGDAPGFQALEGKLRDAEATVLALFEELVT